MPFISVNNLKIDFRLRRSSRARRLQLQYHYDGFEVVAPLRIKNGLIISFVWEMRFWMANKNNQDTQNKTTCFYQDNKLLYRGRQLWVSQLFGAHPKVDWINENELVCILSELNAENLHDILLKWLKDETNQIVQKVIDEVCPQLGKWPQKVRLKNQKTRWGSCGINNAIQINWRLIFAPAGVLEYVVVHELCHLLYRGHGIRFWNQVAKYDPHYKQARKWLTEHGDDIMRMSLDPVISSQESFRSPLSSL